ncbi:MAG TPA: LuxR C-terminal-related transcriptional regulator, partial [Gaiellales bacterium]|nr:LuxR C-terminal-related transcriptional regulator [Gaiellales bacterium]
ADAIADAGPSLMADFVEVSLSRLAACRGRLTEARRRARTALRAGQQSGVVPVVYNATWVLGFCELAGGDHAATDRRLGPLVAAMVEVGLGEPTFARFVPDELEALVRLDRLDEAERALAVWEERGRELDRHFALATGARCRALLCGARGDRTAALAACDEALTHHELLGEPFEEARTRLVAGSLLRRARRRSAARGMLEAARTEFTRLGARTWRAAAEAELARLAGGTAGSSSLTAAEQRVAAEVARGRTNREVAAALYISESTVEGTLWRVYRKLGVRSRSELARLLATTQPPDGR